MKVISRFTTCYIAMASVVCFLVVILLLLRLHQSNEETLLTRELVH